MEKDNTPLPIL